MLRDASHHQVTEKFSFIESLNLSRQIDRGDKKILDQIDLDRAFNFVPQINAKALNKANSSSSAIVTVASDTATIDTNWYQSNLDEYNLSLAEIVKDSATQQPTDDYKPKHRNYLGKILFSTTCSYCLFVFWWLFGHQGNKILTTLMGGQQITISKSDVEFIDYMEKSINSIDEQVEAKKSSDSQKKVVYVPVYTPKSTPPTFPQVSSSNIPLTSSFSSNPPTPSKSVAMAQPKPDLSTEALKIPAPPPLPAPTPIANTNTSSTPTKVATINNQPAIKHTLIGILELGEARSAALIKVNGQTRRFWTGENIGNSGWILESVTNSSAKISDRGEIRSLAVGETF